ncbi:hypothetical protein LTR53_007934 [Teratosphaeriaceae sp. CCFEE 6253]|nr:hypothetical protein LTR53_007934 [Teratosphaeriaceae sp. CCFEE 6253]
MSSRTRTPAALEPYLRLPPADSLTLLTGTLGNSAHWLLARFAGSLLTRQPTAPHDDPLGVQAPEAAVVLVSWLRDLTFWKAELRRSGGVDTTTLMKERRFAFVDCFTTLGALNQGEGDALAVMERSITAAIHDTTSAQKSRPTVLLLDNPDVLLALGLSTAPHLSALLLRLRSSVHATILSCAADSPLLSAAAAAAVTSEAAEPLATALEAAAAAFAVQQAHAARVVMGVRGLETGAAGDVSGELRVTRGAGVYDAEDDEEEGTQEWVKKEGKDDGVPNGEVRELEALYLVQRDGSVKVFERGSSAL